MGRIAHLLLYDTAADGYGARLDLFITRPQLGRVGMSAGFA